MKQWMFFFLQFGNLYKSKKREKSKLNETEAHMEAYSKAKACIEMPTGTIQWQTEEWTKQTRETEQDRQTDGCLKQLGIK